jgi:MYXO-CTERM domain-containing protein
MSRSTRFRRQMATLFAVSLGAAVSSSAVEAASPVYLRLQYGVGGPQAKNGGPGAEQPSSSFIYKDGKTYVVTVWMSSFVEENDRNWQCKCTSVQMGKNGPAILVDQKQLTQGGGDRPCNHPRTASDGAHVVWTFGSDMNDQTNVSTYAGVLNEMCEHVVDPIRVSDNHNNNEGAPDADFNGKVGDVSYFSAGYLSTNTDDTSFAIGLQLTDDGTNVTLQKSYKTAVVTPANIGRPAIVAGGTDRTLFCAAKGDQRPPEDGVECAWLDAITGAIKWRHIIAASDPGNNVYMNQPSVARLDFGRFAVNVQESNAGGNHEDVKGTNISHLYVIEPGETNYTQKARADKLGIYQTHAAICGGQYGTDGARAVGIFSASITGAGQPELLFAKYDATTGVVSNPSKDSWIVADYGDSGYLANLYGQNPNTQGRDFLRCTGDLKNPAHGDPDGFMPDVETFVVAPLAGRKPGEPKNALWLSFVPGKTDVPVTPEPPQEGTGSAGTGPSTSASSGGGDTGAGGGGNGLEPSGGFKTTDTGGCACAVPGETAPSSNMAGALVGLALGMLGVSRRRREEGRS